jgi:NTP pyrophosphatase (non-canonical NTP hydrolase)
LKPDTSEWDKFRQDLREATDELRKAGSAVSREGEHAAARLSFDHYQQAADKTAIYPNKGSNLAYPILGLLGEAGELANKYKKVLRDHGGIPPAGFAGNFADELGDVLWYVSAIATELGWPLADVARGNLDKLAARAERGTLTGSGDAR